MNISILFVLFVDCRFTDLGKEYIGQYRMTISGIACQRWDSQKPHSHNDNIASMFPDATLADASNYCRNPDSKDGGLWCYTSDPDKQWEFCNVPKCHGNKIE